MGTIFGYLPVIFGAIGIGIAVWTVITKKSTPHKRQFATEFGFNDDGNDDVVTMPEKENAEKQENKDALIA